MEPEELNTIPDEVLLVSCGWKSRSNAKSLYYKVNERIVLQMTNLDYYN